MRKVTCDLCGKELPNDTTATDVLGISVDVCEACQRWFNGLGTKKQLDLMFEGLRRARKQAIAAENGPVLRSPPPEPTEDQDGRTDGRRSSRIEGPLCAAEAGGAGGAGGI